MLTHSIAKDVWKAKWLGIKLRDLISKYDQDPRRFYEVWEEKCNKGSRLEAFEEFRLEHPKLASATDPSPHIPKRRVVMLPSRQSPEQQLSFALIMDSN